MALRERERADRAPANRSRAIGGARTSAFRSQLRSGSHPRCLQRRHRGGDSTKRRPLRPTQQTRRKPRCRRMSRCDPGSGQSSLWHRTRGVNRAAVEARARPGIARHPVAVGATGDAVSTAIVSMRHRVGRVATQGRRIRLRFSPYSRQLRRKRLDPAEARAPSLRRLAQTLRRSAVDARSHRQTSLVCRIRCAQIAVKDQLRHGLFVSFLSGITQIGCLNGMRSLVKPPRGFLCSSCGHPAAHS